MSDKAHCRVNDSRTCAATKGSLREAFRAACSQRRTFDESMNENALAYDLLRGAARRVK